VDSLLDFIVNKFPKFMALLLTHGDHVLSLKAKKKQLLYESIQKFQISWVANLPWAELQMDPMDVCILSSAKFVQGWNKKTINT
jgi:hypothetical protein